MKSKITLKYFSLFLIAVVGLIIGLYSLSFFEPKEDTLKQMPAPPSEIIPKYNEKIQDLGETCGYINGNCKVCLECAGPEGTLKREDFKQGGKQGTCKYVNEEQGDDMFCPLPIRRCDGKGNCIECYKDEHCGDCGRCAVDFFKIPGQIDKGECLPKETKNNRPCSADLYRDGFEGQGICMHGECISK